MNDVKTTELSMAAVTKPVNLPSAQSATSSPPIEPKVKSGVATSTPDTQAAKQSSAAQPTNDIANKQQQQLEREQSHELREAVTKLNEYVQSVQRDLQFELDEVSGRTVITVLDRTTKEVVRQIPDDLALKLARNLQQDEPVNLFSAKA
ncbi:flagellar protein FlaG [Hahella sp. HN01]|uniref:flagellar protein FlaG n=1 Tax=Hahella sp. HN01 TaxID=2847262 RepID=UPI001C1EF650|nr:flagellar protein FlaG [Hahella sp. HN01]MBU6953018.1 flagellar protein FlaG [Hahella sp. HN01]